jgi:hypothetical protein
MMMMATMTIMSDLLCMSSTYDFVTFENNCVSELFFRWSQNTQTYVIFACHSAHALILWQPVKSSDRVALLCYDPNETLSLCTVGFTSTLFTITCYLEAYLVIQFACGAFKSKGNSV